MPAKDLGAKHTCFKCGAKFYDMKKPVAVCPKCGADQREAPVIKAPPPEKRARAAARPAPVTPEPSGEDGEVEVETDGDLDEADDDDDDEEAGDDD